MACKCTYRGLWTCRGSVFPCKNTDSHYCKHPDTSIHACIQGGGDCDGYVNKKCDCDYKPGGCRISQKVVSGTACKCIYKRLLTCVGEVVKCRNPTSTQCIYPDKSVNSCVQGNKRFSFLLFFYLFRCHISRTSTEHKTASLADEGNSAYCQSSGAHNIKHI